MHIDHRNVCVDGLEQVVLGLRHHLGPMEMHTAVREGTRWPSAMSSPPVHHRIALPMRSPHERVTCHGQLMIQSEDFWRIAISHVNRVGNCVFRLVFVRLRGCVVSSSSPHKQNRDHHKPAYRQTILQQHPPATAHRQNLPHAPAERHCFRRLLRVRRTSPSSPRLAPVTATVAAEASSMSGTRSAAIGAAMLSADGLTA